MTIEARVEALDRVLAYIDEVLEAAGCPMAIQFKIDVAVEELFVNVASYAYETGTGSCEIVIRIEEEGDEKTAVIILSDQGIPYNPFAREDPDITAAAEDREIGGLGVFMVKKSMDTAEYEYYEGRNVVTLRKSFGG